MHGCRRERGLPGLGVGDVGSGARVELRRGAGGDAQEEGDSGRVVIGPGDVERGAAGTLDVAARAMGEKEADDSIVTASGGGHKRRHTGRLDGIDVGAASDEGRRHLEPVIPDSGV